MNNRKAKILRARARYHPKQLRTYAFLNERMYLHGRLPPIRWGTVVCRNPEYRRYKAWKRLEKGVI